MRDTSLQAYDSIRDKLTQKQLDVYGFYRTYGAMANKEVSEKMGKPINEITGRTGELVKLGFLFCIGTKKINGRNHRILDTKPKIQYEMGF